MTNKTLAILLILL